MNRDELETAERERSLLVARHAAPPSGSAFVADTSTALLRTIAEVLDIRRVFPRVSEIVKPVLPHDALVLVFLDSRGPGDARSPSGRGSAAARVAHASRRQGVRHPDDLSATVVAAHGLEPAVADALIAAGYRSVLSVRGLAQNQVMHLEFVSRQVDAYTSADLPAAQHVADYVSLAVAHEQLAAAEGSRAEARGRSSESTRGCGRSPTKGEALPSHGQMVGRIGRMASACWPGRCAWPDRHDRLSAGGVGDREGSRRAIHSPGVASERRPIRRDSTAPRCRSNCSSRSCSATSAGPSPGAHQAKAGQIELASRGCCFSTR